MKIAKRFKLNTWISLIVTVLIALSITWSFLTLERNIQNEKLIDEIRKIAFERITLRDYYLLYREERASNQWQAKSETLRRLMETAAERITTTKDKALLQEARQDFDATVSGFIMILDRDKRERHKANIIIAPDEKSARQIGQVFLKSYNLMDSIGRLHESTTRASLKARNTAIFLILFFFIFGGITVVVNSSLLSKLITKRLRPLKEWIEMIGRGNLDYKITLAGNDELTDLAKAMNETTDKLKHSYTSVENLQQEIDQRQLVQEKLDRSNRILSVLNHIDQTIVRSGEQNELFTEACLIAVKYGKFCMAWIGLIDEQEHTVIPFCWSGVEEGYLTQIEKISTYDIPEGRGPTGRAVREGKLYYCNNIENDPIMAPWREEALRRGYRSSIALPLICQSRIIGAFTIYADQPFFFDEAEVTMLDEIINDINYALNNMESEKIRRQMEDEIRRINEELEQRVIERTAELTVKTTELQRINKVFVDRELRMRELKERIAELERKEE